MRKVERGDHATDLLHSINMGIFYLTNFVLPW